MFKRIILIIICVFASGCFLQENRVVKKVNSISEYKKSDPERWEWKLQDGKMGEFDVKGIDIDLKFEQIEVKEVVKLIMNILDENFIVVGDMVGLVDVEIRGNFVRKEVIKMIRAVVNSKGYDIVRDGEIYRIYNIGEEGNINIKHSTDPSKSIYLYHLQYEKVETVVSLLNDVFDDSEISQNKNVNMIIIKASKDEYVKIRDVIRRIDKRPKQVFVEFTIMEVTLSNGLQYGVEYFIRKNKKTRGGNISLLPNSIASGVGNVIGDGLKTFSINRNFESFVTLLRSETNVEIISKPNVLVKHGERSVIKIGRSEPIKKGTTISDNGQAAENIEYRDVGIILRVGVEVEENNIVKLNLNQEISDIVSASANPLISSPSFTNTQIQMNVLIRDGEKIYIGGLIKTEINKKIKKVPFFGDIPYLGKVFRSEDNVESKKELILLVSVRVLKDDEALKRNSFKYIRKV